MVAADFGRVHGASPGGQKSPERVDFRYNLGTVKERPGGAVNVPGPTPRVGHSLGASGTVPRSAAASHSRLR